MEVLCYYCASYPDRYNIKFGEQMKNIAVWNSCGKHTWQDSLVIKYETFRTANIGFVYQDKLTGKIFRKLQLWYRYINSEKDLLLLMADQHPLYRRVQHQDWVDYNGVMRLRPDIIDTIYKETNKYGQYKASVSEN